MHPIDEALRDAWHTLAHRLAQDPDEAHRRAARAARAIQNPVAAWCIRLRAADTRIDDWGIPHDPDLAAAHHPHPLHLTQWDIKDLTAPVHFPYPGLDWTDAAKTLGRPRTTIQEWIKAGIFETTWYDDRARGKPGLPVPWVHTRAPLAPGARRGQPPHPMWGSLWQGLAEDLPREYTTTVWRVWHPNGPMAAVEQGWHFRCPGRYYALEGELSEEAVKRSQGAAGVRMVEREDGRYLHVACDRLAKAVYLPMPCGTIADLSGPLPGVEHLKPAWAKDLSRPPACRYCWNVKQTRPLDGPRGGEGWNQLVTALSGGYLRGREVKRPLDALPRGEWKPRTTHFHVRAVERRRTILDMVLEGKTPPQIGEALGVSLPTVGYHIKRLREEHGVATCDELRAKLGPWHVPRITGSAAGDARRA